VSELASGIADPESRPRTPAARGRALAYAAAAIALAAASTAIAIGSGGSGSGAGAAVPAFHYLGRAPAGLRVSFTVALRLPGSRRLSSALRSIEDPRSASFHRFIGPRAFGSRFGLAPAAVDALKRTLRRDRLRIAGDYPQRTGLRVSGTVAAVQRLLSVRIGVWEDAAGRRYHAPTGRVEVPAALAREVDAVTGLDTRPRWIPHDVPLGGLSPVAAATAYDLSTLHQAGFEGQGLKIAVISFSAFDPSDPAGFVSHYRIAGPAPRVISVDGGNRATSGGDEADLDIEVIRAIAPKAQILFYEVPPTTSAYTDVVNRIVADRQAQIISTSWGECERQVPPAEQASDAQAFSAAVAAGISMFASSGDSGAYDCQRSNFGDHRLTVDWPASSASAIAVGGTRLSVARDGAYAGESAWEDQLSDAGGGGGLSIGDPRPSWQSGPGVQTRLSSGRRQVPDVSADADPGTPWAVYVKRRAREVGGTSAAAPFWAAAMLLIQQYAAANGVSRLGFVDPILYALARSHQQFPPFHDVTRGANRYYRAGAGWDPATGLGSPDVANLARDIVGYLRAHRG
jgi:kumamolisin